MPTGSCAPATARLSDLLLPPEVAGMVRAHVRASLADAIQTRLDERERGLEADLYASLFLTHGVRVHGRTDG